MPKIKAKNETKTLSPRAFIGLWAGSYASFWMALWILLEHREYRSYAFNTPAFVLGITIITLITTMLQSRVGEQFFKQSMRGWVPASVLGSVIAVLAFAASQSLDLLTSSLALSLPIALAQMAWLWGRVKSAWLWPLASLVAIPLFVFPFREYDALWETGVLPFFVLLLGLTQGVMQATVMRYLWTQPKEAEKRNMGLAVEGQSDQARLERLGEHETNGTFEVVDEDQIAQHEAR